MLTIFVKEINSFFSSLVGYLAIIGFLVVISLFLWVFPDTSVLEYGYANLDSLFVIAPWIFMFLIPAITMRSFSEEFKSGTYELLATRPLYDWQIILGKYFAALFLVVFALVPTLLYFYTVSVLSMPPGIDTGATWGSYIGLLLLGATFAAIGLFSSSVSKNQIVAFLLAIFLCFFLYQAFDYLSQLNVFYAKLDNIVELIGMNAHYASLSRGVVDTRDLLYFFSIIGVFLLLTQTVVQSRKW